MSQNKFLVKKDFWTKRFLGPEKMFSFKQAWRRSTNILRLMCIRNKKYRKVEYVQRRVCFVYLQLSLHENVVFSVCTRMDNASYIIFIMWNSISSLDTWYHFQFNIRCGVAVTGRSPKKISGNFLRGGKRDKKKFEGRANFWGCLHF